VKKRADVCLFSLFANMKKGVFVSTLAGYIQTVIKTASFCWGKGVLKKFKFRALQKICLYFYDVECTLLARLVGK
jgi:hypothetical protein